MYKIGTNTEKLYSFRKNSIIRFQTLHNH